MEEVSNGISYVTTKQRCKYTTSVDIRSVQQKVPHSKSPATRTQWLCLRAGNVEIYKWSTKIIRIKQKTYLRLSVMNFLTHLVSVMPRLWPLLFLSCLVYDLSSFYHASFMASLLSVMPRLWPLFFLSCLVYGLSSFCHTSFMASLLSVMPRLWPLFFLSYVYGLSSFCHTSFMASLLSVIRLWPLFFLSCLVYGLSSFCHTFMASLLSVIPRLWPLFFLSYVYGLSSFCHTFMASLLSVIPRLWPLFFLSYVYGLSSFCHTSFMASLLSVIRLWPLFFLSCLVHDPSCFCHALFRTSLVSVMPLSFIFRGTWDGDEAPGVGHLVCPDDGQDVLHSLGAPQEVEHSQVHDHRLRREHLHNKLQQTSGSEMLVLMEIHKLCCPPQNNNNNKKHIRQWPRSYSNHFAHFPLLSRTILATPQLTERILSTDSKVRCAFCAHSYMIIIHINQSVNIFIDACQVNYM